LDYIDKIDYYLDIAETALNNGNCPHINFGVAIVLDGVVIYTGYSHIAQINKASKIQE
jgi:dCMP deaminase